MRRGFSTYPHGLLSVPGGRLEFGGQGTEPYEQNTQQSPDLGRMMTWQPGHSHRKTQASAGIISTDCAAHEGQWMVLWTGTTILQMYLARRLGV